MDRASLQITCGGMAYADVERKTISLGTDVAKFDILPLSLYQPKSKRVSWR